VTPKHLVQKQCDARKFAFLYTGSRSFGRDNRSKVLVCTPRSFSHSFFIKVFSSCKTARCVLLRTRTWGSQGWRSWVCRARWRFAVRVRKHCGASSSLISGRRGRSRRRSCSGSSGVWLGRRSRSSRLKRNVSFSSFQFTCDV
jgi:hypothetical protein